jgi:phosphatidylserine/phosphatidylglycerophosphate/cardiolipin synthase-like enzyme
MQIGPLFNVGGNRVDRNEVNPELIQTMADSARNIRTEGNPAPAAWTELADRVSKDDQVSPEDLKQILDLSKSCYRHHYRLHSELKASGYKDRKIRAELQDLHVFEAGASKIKQSVALAQSQIAVQALAGASFGPTGLVSAFVTHSNLQKRALEPLMTQIQGLRDGTSPSLFQGNSAEGVRGPEVWKKMNDLLDGAIASGNSGKPVEVNAQYYELTNQDIVGKLAQAAQAGNKVRVNVDPGRLVAFQGSHVVIDEVPDKMRALLQLSQTKGDVGISMYPISKQLGNPNNLMHRKGLRVGEQFFLSGMNANQGSGENIDVGYVLEGPAARQLVQNFARDVEHSSNTTMEEVFGEKPLAGFMDGDINMRGRGLASLIDCVGGPSPAGTQLPQINSYADLKALADQHGERALDYTDLNMAELDKALQSGQDIPLSKKGKQKFLALAERTLEATRTPKNLRSLADISLPEGKATGTSTVALADYPEERQALMLTAIQEAEEFIYMPAFVITRSVASMLVARRDELKAEGKDLDIRVIADPGVYPDGGTPNEYGVKFLENAGIPVHWALLPRTDEHDRKVHAKAMLTDKGEFFGSTNFSNKGLIDNWEQSGYVQIDPQDKAARQDHALAVADFLEMWEEKSFGLNSLEKGLEMREQSKGDKDYLVQADEARYGIVRTVIRGIERVEKASARFIQQQAADPKTAERISALVEEGYDEGSAMLMAVREKMGDEAFFQALRSLEARQDLEGLK